MIFLLYSMKVSILLTSYNIEDWIDDSIRSVVEQDMPFEWELLIGDDGSSDGTVSKILSWEKRFPDNIKLFERERNGTCLKSGLRAARNRAALLEKAKGEYIQFLDGDDVFTYSRKIRTQVAFLDNPDNKDCVCCGHNMEVYNVKTGNRRLLTKGIEPQKKYTINEYWGHYYYSTDTIMFRRVCLPKMLNELYRDYLNDNFITFIILQYGKIYYMDKVWARYNVTGIGLWTGGNLVYGAFRNMQLFDLEMYLRPDLEREIFLKHGRNILTIKKYYAEKHVSSIDSLFRDVDGELFRFSFLLRRMNGLSKKEQKDKDLLFLKASIAKYMAMFYAMKTRLQACCGSHR